ncbi:hypothetical protein L6452_19859 [Arctium lappa]|uniref:Uncharacterized protein n=1 Tax=Arctium lappa TaxID=4217 RepID=A0ACB9BAM9_ARCLA|nr:hypothetical protein L6452_19859 [Arctium lappa]
MKKQTEANREDDLRSDCENVRFVDRSPRLTKSYLLDHQIVRKVADILIPKTLELGGKDPFIVCKDVVVPHAQF